MNTRYYELQALLIEDGRIETAEGRSEDLKNLEDELNWPENGGDWLAYHFNSTAEYLYENDPSEISDEEFEALVEQAKREIEVISKANNGRYEGIAKNLDGWLEEVVAERNS